MKGKPVSYSKIDEQTATVFPNDLNTHGTLFGGRVLEMADWICAIVAKRHTGTDCVTLGLDSVRFLAPAKSGDILIFKAALNRTWKTSMEIGIKVLAHDYKQGQVHQIFSAYFTFVAVGSDGKPVPVPEVIPETSEEKRRFNAAEIRRKGRLSS